MKNLWIIANWKSNKTLEEALQWLSIVGSGIEKKDNINVAVCPDFTALEEMAKEIKAGGYPILLGSQDISPFEMGAFTGAEPAAILKQFVSLSIVGHSERRKNFGETDEMVAQKVTQSMNNQISPVVCVPDEKTPVPHGVKVVAYEPIFAIGTGQPDTPENADAVSSQIKQKYGNELEILYGGSVNHENCKSFVIKENISGLLIGKSSLDPEEFLKIIQQCAQL